MEKFYFDAGLDPNFRIARYAGQMNEKTTMFRLARFASEYHLVGEFAAKTVGMQAFSGSDVNAGLNVGAEMLRDCYGKINCFAASVNTPYFDDIAKLLKTYRKDIRIIAAASDDVSDAISSYADIIVHIKAEDAAETAKKVSELENVNIGIASAAALCAMKEEAQRRRDKHARYVVLIVN